MATCSTAGTTGKVEDEAPSGMIHWEIDRVSKLTTTRRYSHTIHVHGVPWRLSACKISDDLSVYLHGLQNASIIWSFDLDVQFILLNADSDENYSMKFNFTMNHSCEGKGYAKFIKWSVLMDKSKGYVVDDKMTIESRFTLTKIMGIRPIPRFQFSDPNDPRHDVTLVIGDNKVHVSKQFLSLHSETFNEIFYETHRDQKVVELQNADYKEFIELLNVLYPSNKKITAENAEMLLSLAEQFQMKTIFDRVENFLINTEEKTIATKLRLSDQYSLVELQGDCLDQLKTIKSVTTLKNTADYKKFSNFLKLTLFEKILKLSDKD